MLNKCPGQQNIRDLDSVVVPCPACGNLVEFFTDEPKRKCRCGKVILRESLPKCAEWCPAASVCLGEALDVRELERRLEEAKKMRETNKCLKDVQDRLKKKADGDTSE